jgi:hypothetical protein
MLENQNQNAMKVEDYVYTILGRSGDARSYGYMMHDD